MVQDTIITYFKTEFERFWTMLEKQVEVCPEALWGQKAGGYIFWQQIWHTIACAEMFTVEEAGARIPAMEKYSREVAVLTQTLDRAPSKEEILSEAARVKKLVLDYYDGLTAASLTQDHPAMTRRMGKPHTKFHAALAQIRHCNYHVGGCDACLRDHGIPGVY